MLSLISEPLQYAFMQKALLGILLASINCAAIGVYVVLKRISFLGEALTHTLLPGIVFAYIRGFHLFWGALGASLATALGIGVITSKSSVRQDSAIGIMLSFMFALGVLMMSTIRSFRDFSSILFGSILGVTTGDLLLMGSVTFVVVNLLYWLYKEFQLSALDPTYARLIKAKPEFLHYLTLFLIALSVVSAVQMIGALLTTALLITPAATASLVARSLRQMLFLSVGIAALCGTLGLYTSYYFEFSAGAAIVLNCSVAFFLVGITKKLRNTILRSKLV